MCSGFGDAWCGYCFGECGRSGISRLDSGTSMAAPHLAGLAALLIEACPTSTVQQLQDAICQSCARMPAMQVDRVNLGMPDAVKALSVLQALVTTQKTATA